MPPSRLRQALQDLDSELATLDDHGGSRYVGANADRETIEHVAKGGTLDARGRPIRRKGSSGLDVKSGDDDLYRLVQPRSGGSPTGFAKALLDVAQHRTDGMTPVRGEKALAELTDASGGFLLVPEIADSVLMLIRSRVAVQQMPITRVQPRSKEYLLPGLSAGASASWLTENASIPASAEAFELVGTMVPRPLGALVAISNRLLADATSDNPSAAASAESVIQADVADLMAVSMDAGLLQGDAAGPAPKGILRYTGTTPLPAGTIATNGSSPSYSILTAIVGALQQQSMPFTSPGWIFSGRTLTSLMNLTDSMGRPLLAGAGLLTVDKAGSTGTLLGYRFAVTNAVPNNQTYGTSNNASTILFSSDWSELFVGDWERLAVDASQEASYTPDGGTTWISAYQNMQTLFRSWLWADMAIRRPSAWVLASGILP